MKASKVLSKRYLIIGLCFLMLGVSLLILGVKHHREDLETQEAMEDLMHGREVREGIKINLRAWEELIHRDVAEEPDYPWFFYVGFMCCFLGLCLLYNAHSAYSGYHELLNEEISYRCPRCSSNVNLRDAEWDQLFRCPSCGVLIHGLKQSERHYD